MLNQMLSHAEKFEQAADEWQRMIGTVADQLGHLNDDCSDIIISISEQRAQFTRRFSILQTEFNKLFNDQTIPPAN